MMGNSCLFFRALFGALAVAAFICLLLVGNMESEGNSTTSLTTKSTGNLKRMEDLGRPKFIDHPELDLNYMSKRRVPNGPDPIHNRRAGNFRRPPGTIVGIKV